MDKDTNPNVQMAAALFKLFEESAGTPYVQGSPDDALIDGKFNLVHMVELLRGREYLEQRISNLEALLRQVLEACDE